MTQYYAPARLDEATAQAVLDLAVAVHRTLGLRDISRTDVIVDVERASMWFLEVDVAPGMTETSLPPQAVSAGGEQLSVLYRQMVDAARLR